MQSLMIFEKQPFEYSDHKCNPIGYRLVDFLPVEWQEIESGVQEHGFHIEGTTPKEAENLSSEEIVERIKAKLRKGGKFVSLRDIAFQNLVCEFLKVCNENKHHYTEANFIHVMGINGFNIPHYFYRAFDLYKKEEVSTMCFMHSNLYNVSDTLSDIKESPIVFARQYRCETDIDYYIAVILEIIRQGKFIKQCEHCGRWFVTEKKTDEKYCKRTSPYNDKKTCAQVMRKIKEAQRIKKSPLAKAKEQARNRANSRETYHPGAADEYKLLVSRWDTLYKSGRISEEEYIALLNDCMRSTKRGENA